MLDCVYNNGQSVTNTPDGEDVIRHFSGSRFDGISSVAKQNGLRFVHPLKAAVCCITRNRPKMLSELLGSLEKLEAVPDCETVFIIVENDGKEKCRALVEETIPRFLPQRLTYASEAKSGIPIARNTAIDIALDEDADVILFIDDDESADAGWLRQMVTEYRQSGAMLVGGPVYARFPDASLEDTVSASIRDGVEARYRRVAAKALRKLKRGRNEHITIVTNNWLADKRLFTDHGLRFDVSLRSTGGSDTKFFRAVREKAGLSTSWAPHAIVHETVPPERLTASYQFRRGMEQSKTSLRAKLETYPAWQILPVMAVSIVLRALSLLLLLIRYPFDSGLTLVRLLRSAGWIVGRVSGFLGSRSRLYESTTGF
ncbi:MAG: glycosyltransferase [Pseudomonadota bacterium]